MVPQSDVAVAGVVGARGVLPSGVRHVAWVRGLPWPGRGEQSTARTLTLRALETRALRRADDVWANSALLARQIACARAAPVVPGGVTLLDRVTDGTAAGPLLWAGRLSSEKGPAEFVEIARRTGLPARAHGGGPLLDTLRTSAPTTLEWRGWGAPEDIWGAPGIALCTSYRDAFGRSPVEAASAGLPVVLSDQTGVAPLLYTDPALAARFVLSLDDTAAWDTAVRDLVADEGLRRRVSDHVHGNAQALSVAASLDAALAALARPTTEGVR